jgi:hypothetical protein
MLCATMRSAQRVTIALLLCVAPIHAVAAETPGASSVFEKTLKPGQFVWKPEAAAQGPVKVVVSLPLQTAYVYRGQTPIGVSTVSTGMPGYDTPVGRFTILQKKVTHRSNLYDDAPMPYMQRLTWDGVALHAGHVSGEPESHGCIRLPAAFAKKLYAATTLGASVVVTDEAPASASEALAAAARTTGPVAATALASSVP